MNVLVFKSALVTKGALGTTIVNIGFPPAIVISTAYLDFPELITSEDSAISKGMAMLRRIQAEGLDARLEVDGAVEDDNAWPAAWPSSVFVPSGKPLPTNPVRAMTTGEKAEQPFARIDTVDRGLSRRINASNRSATSSLDPNFFGDNELEDTLDKATILGEI